MKQINAIAITPLALLLASLGIGRGQGTIHVTFDKLPPLPPGSHVPIFDYSESGVGVHARDGYFIIRMSGDPLYPDNSSTYIQPWGSRVLYFDYWGSGRPFDAVSVDLALYSAASLEPVTVQFDAWGYSVPLATTRFTVTANVDSQGRPMFQTFYFPPEFRGMRYLFVTPTAPLWSLDNLVIYVPEPSTWALLVLGAGELVFWSFRRRAKRQGALRAAQSQGCWCPDCADGGHSAAR